MKTLLIIPVLFFTACASRPVKKIIIANTEPSRAVDAPLRFGETIREYRFGRYADPRNPLVMHESHPVYRVESTAHWNLAGGNPQLPTGNAKATAKDAAIAEENKQRMATDAFIKQTSTLNERLTQLAQTAAQSHELAKQNVALKRDVIVMQQRLDSFEQSLRERLAEPPKLPKPAEDKW